MHQVQRLSWYSVPSSSSGNVSSFGGGECTWSVDPFFSNSILMNKSNASSSMDIKGAVWWLMMVGGGVLRGESRDRSIGDHGRTGRPFSPDMSDIIGGSSSRTMFVLLTSNDCINNSSSVGCSEEDDGWHGILGFGLLYRCCGREGRTFGSNKKCEAEWMTHTSNDLYDAIVHPTDEKIRLRSKPVEHSTNIKEIIFWCLTQRIVNFCCDATQRGIRGGSRDYLMVPKVRHWNILSKADGPREDHNQTIGL